MKNLIPLQHSGYDPTDDLKKDIRDIQYSSIETVDLNKVPEEHLPINPIPDYQNGRPFCVLHGVSYAMRLLYDHDNSEPFLAAIAEWKESGLKDIPFKEYYTITRGTSLKCGLWAAQHSGACKESLYPPGNKDWKWLSDKNNVPPEAFKDAQKNRIGKYLRIGQAGWGNLTADEIMHAIWKWKAVIIGMRYWRDGWYRKYPVPTGNGTTLYHCIDLDGIVSKSNQIVREVNWYDHTYTNQGNGKAWSYMRLKEWIPHICAAFVITQYPIMRKLVRSPAHFTEVYAIHLGVVKRHVTNRQTLKLGAEDPDKFWEWKEGKGIPVATSKEWALPEGAEICLLPKD